MATTDLKVMVRQALEKDGVFFEEAVTRIEDLRFYISRFNVSYDDLMVEKVDEYIARLKELRGRIAGLDKKDSDSLKSPPKYDKTKPLPPESKQKPAEPHTEVAGK